MAKTIKITDVYNFAKERLQLGVRQGRIYIKNGEHWKSILPHDLAIKIRGLYDEQTQNSISSSAIKEVIERLTQDPNLQLFFYNEKYENFLPLKNGIFNVEEKELQKSQQDFSYYLDISYVSKDARKTPNFDKFIASSFPDEALEKRKLLAQILGYCISDYTKAKAGFFLIGKSNSGKSVIIDFIRRILPEEAVTAIPLYRLGNRFNLARLAEAKVNICTEIDEKSFAATDIFKMLTSNELVTAEHKGGKPFEFRLRCKSLNAGNFLPDLKGSEGLDAMVNRMVILLFPKSISKESQDTMLADKLWSERDGIFSEAIDALVDLVKNNFTFSEPQDSNKMKQDLHAQEKALDYFLSERCKFAPGAKEHLVTLYESYIEYCHDNLIEMRYTKATFSQFLSQLPGIKRAKFRISGSKPLSGVYGLRLVNPSEYSFQDSGFSPIRTVTHNTDLRGKDRNVGTSERGEETHEK